MKLNDAHKESPGGKPCPFSIEEFAKIVERVPDDSHTGRMFRDVFGQLNLGVQDLYDQYRAEWPEDKGGERYVALMTRLVVQLHGQAVSLILSMQGNEVLSKHRDFIAQAAWKCADQSFHDVAVGAAVLDVLTGLVGGVKARGEFPIPPDPDAPKPC